MKQFFDPFETILSEINTLMSKLKSLKLSWKLRKYTDLRPVQRNDTRLSSTFEMLYRYKRIREILNQTDFLTDLFILFYLLSPSENTQVETLLQNLDFLEGITKSLQDVSTDLGDLRVLFDKVILKYRHLKASLHPEASIFHSPSLEAAIVKIQDKKKSMITDVEKQSCDMLKVQLTPFEETFEVNDDDDLIQNLKKGAWKNMRKMKKKPTKIPDFRLRRLTLWKSFLTRLVSLTLIIG